VKDASGDGGTISFHLSKADAMSGDNRVNLSSAGSGSDHLLTQTTDRDAAQQGENAAGMVSDNLTVFEDDTNRSDTNNSSNERLADVTNEGASKLSSGRPSADSITLRLAEEVLTITGTAAIIESG